MSLAINSVDSALTVGELTRHIKGLFEEDDILSNCWVRGEISNFTHHSSGHMYFTLKDDTSRIRTIMFSRHNKNLPFIPREGMQVIARGYVSIFERDGQYQLYVEEMQPDGIGSLYLAFQQLRERLELEGLFKADTKKPLPLFPKVIGVATSPTGAAIRDILTTLKRRFPIAKVAFIPVLVQGQGAAASIATAIERFNALQEADVLIVGRGGGSLEELWAFNEEVVARAIYASKIPIVSAVGHETDFTIADFVADVRAATPTAAAELASPHIDALRQSIESHEKRMATSLMERMYNYRYRLERARSSTVLQRPDHMFNQRRQRMDQLSRELQLSFMRGANRKSKKLQDAVQRLQAVNPEQKARRLENRLFQAVERLQSHAAASWNRSNHRFERALDKLEMLSPLAVMRRGYALLYQDKQETKLVRSIDQVQLGDVLTVRMTGGRLDCQVWGIEEE